MELWWSFSAETWALIIILITLILLYGYWPYGFFKRVGVPGPKPIPFFGTMLEYRKGIHNFDMECFQKYGKIWGVYEARQPVLCILDSDIIKTVMVKECYSLFTNRRNVRLSGPLYDALPHVEDEDWKRIRSVLSPSFTSSRLNEMFEIMKSQSRSLTDNLQKTSEQGEPADIREFFGAYSLDVVTSTAFGIDINSLNNPNDSFVSNMRKLLQFDFFNPLFLTIALFPCIVPLLEKMGISIFSSEATGFFYSSFQKMKSERLDQHHKKRVDFMQLMIDSQKSEKGHLNGKNTSREGLSDHEILSQSLIFIFAGYETSSKTLSFLFYNLASNPETMKKLQEEIDANFPNKAEVDYDTMMNMDYLDAALSESLRLYPVIFRLQRVCKKTFEIKGLTIPKDTVVMIPTYTLHRDPEYWTDPDTFKPERPFLLVHPFRKRLTIWTELLSQGEVQESRSGKFTKENKESIEPYAYMPFGLGPRNCIGMRFALVIIKLVVVEILQRFDVSLSEETKVPLELINTGILAPKHPIKLKFTIREKC